MRTCLDRAALSLGLVAIAATSFGCDGRSRAGGSKEPTTGPLAAILDISGGMPEEEAAGIFAQVTKKRTFDAFVRTVASLRKEDAVKSVVVKFGETPFGIARAEELGALLESIKKAGKPVFCHADAFGNGALLAASRGCTRMYVSAAGEIEAVGIASQNVYMHKLLADELHLSIDILQVGKFKGAEEPLTRDGPSDEARASLEAVLADIRGTWRDGLTTDRGKAALANAIEDGPYSPDGAKAAGLVDEVGYWDDARDAAKKLSGAVRDEVRFGPGTNDSSDDLGQMVRTITGADEDIGPIALIRASGSISMAGGSGILGGRGGITEKALGHMISRAEKDDDVKAVVLRIDSPGGSALASDLLWHQLMLLRAKKPLVVSIGDMAASGGYFLASTGTTIYANATSIVGSIGVVGGKIAVGDALERIGVHAETFTGKKSDPNATSRAGFNSLLIPWDDATRAKVFATMTAIYNLFLARVAEGRSTSGRTMKPDDVAPSAEGRIFAGVEGKKRGLVDEIGGLEDAIAKARSLAGLPADARVVTVDEKGGLLDVLASSGAPDPGAHASSERGSSTAPIGILSRISPDSAAFIGSVAPLAEGETSVVAMPFALVVR